MPWGGKTQPRWDRKRETSSLWACRGWEWLSRDILLEEVGTQTHLHCAAAATGQTPATLAPITPTIVNTNPQIYCNLSQCTLIRCPRWWRCNVTSSRSDAAPGSSLAASSSDKRYRHTHTHVYCLYNVRVIVQTITRTYTRADTEEAAVSLSCLVLRVTQNTLLFV